MIEFLEFHVAIPTHKDDFTSSKKISQSKVTCKKLAIMLVASMKIRRNIL